MKTLVVYSTKHGATGSCARKIAAVLGAEAFDLGNGKKPPDLSLFDSVVIGTAIYMGKGMPAALHFCEANLAALAEKRLGLFVCGLRETDAEKELAAAFPAPLAQRARVKSFLGGSIDYPSLGLREKLVTRAIMGKTESFSTITGTRIKDFAEKVRAA